MMPLTLAEIAGLAHGDLHDLGAATDADTRVPGPVVADSRRVTPGALFVAVPGTRVDGHDYAGQAVGAGAVAVLASRPVGVPAVVVDDAVHGLGRLAHGYLRHLPDLVVVAVTGSSGKTSTKDFLGQLLAHLGPAVVPEGSFNTEVGLPLTVLRADAQTRYLVLENSARRVGHIAYLCRVAPPRIGVVLNVGVAHIGEFGSRDAIAQAKGELVEALTPDGVAVLNADDPLVLRMHERTAARHVTFGLAAGADVRAVGVRLDAQARPSFTMQTPAGTAQVSLRLHGAHQVSNVLAASAVALELGMPLPQLATALSAAQPLSKWRMQVTTRADGVVVVNDAYNANPESVRAALGALVEMARGPQRRSWAVLGEMAELGETSPQAHRGIGAEVAALGVTRLVTVGPVAAGIADGAVDAGLPASAVERVDDVEGANEALAELLPGDVVLVKASRSAELERVALALLDADGATR